jgi:imidazolonepropionase-like amidohydrolase
VKVNAALAGELDSLLVCDSADNLLAVRNVLGKDANRFGIVHTTDAVDLATELDGYALPLVMGPYDFTSRRRVLLGAAALSNANIEVAFAGGIPRMAPETLRITAAIAVRYGMAAAAARRAITIGPARVAGVAAQVGTIAPGKEGDLVVFSRDPLRLDATVVEVYIKGRRVLAAANQNSPGAGAEQ